MEKTTCYAVRLKKFGNQKTFVEMKRFTGGDAKPGAFCTHYGSLYSWGPLCTGVCFEEKGAKQSMSRMLKEASIADLQVELEVVPVTLSVEG